MMKAINKDIKIGYEYIIGIFIDYPNIEIGVKDNTDDNHFDATLIYSLANYYGSILIFNVYGDWCKLSRARKTLKNLNCIKLIHVPHLKIANGKKKDLVDTQMAFDIAQALIKHPEINLYMIVSGDADFLPVLNEIKKAHKDVFIVSDSNSLSSHLKKKATKVITYQELENIFLLKKIGEKNNGSSK